MMFQSWRAAAGSLFLGAAVAMCCSPVAVEAADASVAWPAVKTDVAEDPKIEARIATLLGQLTLEQKVAQMVQPDIRFVTPDDERKYHLGSILNGGGAFPADNKHAAVSDWVELADRFYDASMDTAYGGPAIPI